MKITVLIENTTQSELVSEHGLSLLIENNGKKYLLDAGQSDKFVANANAMGINLSDVDCGVLSHGHYDHAGGFESFLAISDASVYAMKGFDGKYYSTFGGLHEIGVPRVILDKYSKRFITIDKPSEIDRGVYMLPHSTKGLEKIGERTGLLKAENSDMVPDDFRHEQSLVFETPKGLVIFNSCSHGGVCNIYNEVREFFGEMPIHAFIGGLHMKGMKNGEEICTFSDDEIAQIAELVNSGKISVVYTGHCTGEVGFSKLEKACGNRVKKLYTGKIIFEE